MKLNFYKLLTTLFLCLTINCFAQECNYNFNDGIGDFIVTGLNEHQSGFYTSCEGVSSSENSTDGYAALANNVPEASLVQELGISIPINYNVRALKLNPSEFQNSNRTTATSPTFIITSNILSFDYLQIGMVPNNPYGHTDAYFQYRLLDANDSSVIESGCFVITDSEDDNFNTCRYSSQPYPDNNNVLVVFTPDWVTHEINLNNIGVPAGTSVKLEFTATDCGGATENGTNNHFSTVFIDNICQSNDMQNTFGITMNEFGSLNCPEENFTVSGTYETPNCNDNPVEIKLCMAPYIQGQPGNISNAVVLSTTTFNDFSYSFNINPSALDFTQGQDYNLFVIIDDNDNDLSTYLTIAHDKYEELTFDDCEQLDPCESSNITIANEDDFPTCDELSDFWSFPVNIVINTPPGYDLDQANSDYYSNNFSLDIIDLDNNNEIFTTLETNDIQSGVFQNGILQINYVINYLIMQDANNQGNYAFRVNANLTTDSGICELSYTAYELSFDDCQEEIDPCAEASSISITSTIPQCLNSIETFNVCGTLTLSEEVYLGVQLNLAFNNNGNFFNNVYYQLNRSELEFFTDANGVSTADYCIEVNLSDFPSPLPNDYSMYISYGVYTPNGRCPSIQSETYYLSSASCRSSNEINTISIYPNPAKTEVSIKTNTTKIESIELLDFYGKTIQTKMQINALKHTLDINRLNRGMYVLKIKMKDGSITIKNLILN